MSYRLHQVNENIQRELSQLLAEKALIEDGLLTVTYVSVSPDLRNATVWLSILNNDKPDQVVELLNSRTVELYQPLSQRLKMKYVPRLTFELDTHSNEVDRIDSLIDEISSDET